MLVSSRGFGVAAGESAMTERAKSAVAIRALRKSFGATLAVDDVAFTIEPGTAHALLGENGAGKSTIV
jgi:ribose transport system ATP-binding protein